MDNKMIKPNAPREKLRELRELLKEVGPLLVAYSGGVDSTFLLSEATGVLGHRALGIIADSPSLPRAALAGALAAAKAFGANLEVISTTELDDPRYARNPVNRCYFCKLELFTRMQSLALERGFRTLAYGENADDAFQVRPGASAALQFRVLAPLRMTGLTKAEIRLLSREHGLPTADIPAQPCLSSRIPYGTVVTGNALRMVEQAEEYVRSCGFEIFRVRYFAQANEAPNAKLQVDHGEMEKLSAVESQIREAVRAIGFGDLIVDPDGYRAPARIAHRP
ncbi:MAG: ATP-dependent sacrificial sulfur transferase LarE [Verrucomicrobia bacterium]|nr:ATP-dependent sacrificial sulfur transferase LarE [Verrucomicrobiota bacterium]